LVEGRRREEEERGTNEEERRRRARLVVPPAKGGRSLHQMVAGTTCKGRPEPPGPPWPVPPPGGGHARECPQGRYYRPCMAGTTGQSWPAPPGPGCHAGEEGDRYPRPEPPPRAWPVPPAMVPAEVPLRGPGTLDVSTRLWCISGTMAGTSGRGTARTRNSPI
jgi:hypothetical protein